MDPPVTTHATVREWALVLDAEDIPYTVAPTPDGGWTLVVAPADAERTAAALAAYWTENLPSRESADPAIKLYGRNALGVLVAALLLAFFAVTGSRAGGGAWFARGAAASDRVLAGETWRTVTALTLHADFGHVLANALSGALFFTAVAGVFGPGIGLWLILLAGAGGNALNVWLRGPGYSGVGASTAVFGAVGILAGAQFVRHRRLGMPQGRARIPVAAGVGLLALLGMNPETDILAHILGFVAGLGLGGAAWAAFGRAAARLGAWAQWALAAGALAAVAACWWVAGW